MTVLSIVQSVMGRLSLTQPSIVVTSPDRNVQQMFALLVEEAESLSKAGSPAGWQSLQAEHEFITVAAEEQTNTPIPADLRRFVPDSFFNRSTNRKLTGPLTPQQYQAAQVWPQLTAPYLAFRERQGSFLINPVPPAGETIAYEYISSYWAKSSADQPKAMFTADDDTSYLDEELLKLGLRWRWKQAKGLDYAEDMETYERAVSLALGDDAGSGALDISGPPVGEPIWRANIPEGNWPS
jgi:hypothetical protein